MNYNGEIELPFFPYLKNDKLGSSIKIMRTIKSEEKLNSNSFLHSKERNCLLRRRISSPEIPHVKNYQNTSSFHRQSNFLTKDLSNSYLAKNATQITGLSKNFKLGISNLVKHPKYSSNTKFDITVNAFSSYLKECSLGESNSPSVERFCFFKEKPILKRNCYDYKQTRKEKNIFKVLDNEMIRKNSTSSNLYTKISTFTSDNLAENYVKPEDLKKSFDWNSDFVKNSFLLDKIIYTLVGKTRRVEKSKSKKSSYAKCYSHQIKQRKLCRSVPGGNTSVLAKNLKSKSLIPVSNKDLYLKVSDSEQSTKEDTCKSVVPTKTQKQITVGILTPSKKCDSKNITNKVGSYKLEGEKDGFVLQEIYPGNSECELNNSEKQLNASEEFLKSTIAFTSEDILNSGELLISKQLNENKCDRNQFSDFNDDFDDKKMNYTIISNSFHRKDRVYSSFNSPESECVSYNVNKIDHSVEPKRYSLIDFILSRQFYNGEYRRYKEKKKKKKHSSIFQLYCDFSLLVIGKCSHIFQCSEKCSGKKFAVKIICKSLSGNSQCELAKRNGVFKFLQNLNHPHIVKVYNVFEDEQNFYVIMDLLTGPTLHEFLMSSLPGTLPEIEVKSIIFQIFLALDALHSNDLVHGDIKLENLLFKDENPFIEFISNKTVCPIKRIPVICLIDLDTVKDLGAHSENIIRTNLLDADNYLWKSQFIPNFYMDSQNIGTAPYMSPESHDGLLCTASDMWSCGILMYALFDGNFPFELNESLPLEFRKQITRSQPVIYNPEIWANHTSAWDLCNRLLDPNPITRIQTAREALIHEWFSSESADIFEQLYN